MQPEVRYARTVNGVNIAYQVRGDGPVDLVYTLGMAGNFEIEFEAPWVLDFLSDSRLSRGSSCLTNAGPDCPTAFLERRTSTCGRMICARLWMKPGPNGPCSSETAEGGALGIPDRWRLYRLTADN
jgi:hypothetical protein